MTAEMCSTCGLPDELCVCEDVAKSAVILDVSIEHRTFDKPVTIIDGVDSGGIDASSLSSELKSSFGCGGTVKNGSIELQGDHRGRVEAELRGRGFDLA